MAGCQSHIRNNKLHHVRLGLSIRLVQLLLVGGFFYTTASEEPQSEVTIVIDTDLYPAETQWSFYSGVALGFCLLGYVSSKITALHDRSFDMQAEYSSPSVRQELE
eukprot:1593122-Pleurochrysis_carterae.AAC.2